MTQTTTLVPGLNPAVPVVWLMQNVTDSVDCFDLMHTSEWERMICDKGTDCGFGSLVLAIEQNGFNCPIVLNRHYAGNGFVQGNGHHRLVAAILLGLDTIPVWLETTTDYMVDAVSENHAPLPWGDEANAIESLILDLEADWFASQGW